MSGNKSAKGNEARAVLDKLEAAGLLPWEVDKRGEPTPETIARRKAVMDRLKSPTHHVRERERYDD